MKYIRVDSDGAIARVTLARPEKKNALNRDTAAELLQAFTSCAQHVDTKVVLLAADGPDFCAGADLAALAELLDASPDAQYEDAELLGRVFMAIREMPKPVVAAVTGRALAGGAGLASACDVVYAAEGAEFGYPEVRVGFVPAMVMTMLRRSVGEKRAFELVSTGRRVSAKEALEMGLVSRVLPDAGFQDAVNALVGEMAATSASAQQLTKRLFYQLDDLDFQNGIAAGIRTNIAARRTPDFRAGVERFTRKG